VFILQKVAKHDEREALCFAASPGPPTIDDSFSFVRSPFMMMACNVAYLRYEQRVQKMSGENPNFSKSSEEEESSESEEESSDDTVG
jgi:hypothetical protein